MELSQRQSIARTIVHVISFLVLNLVLIAVFNFLTIDSLANINSRVAAFILSFFIPFFIVYQTRKMSELERLVRFGSGWVVDIILISLIAGFPFGITTGLIPSLTIALGVLYYGGKLVAPRE